MEIILLTINNIKDHNIKKLLDDFELRIKHSIKFSTIIISDNKNTKNFPPKEKKKKKEY